MRWDRLLSNLDETNFRELKTLLEIFRSEVELVFNTSNIPRFFWKVFAGFNFESGYSKERFDREDDCLDLACLATD